MVAGVLKNPWVSTGPVLKFGEDLWVDRNPAAEWTEQEVAVGESPAFRLLFAGKDRAGKPSEDVGEYLFLEEVVPDQCGTPSANPGEMSPLRPDWNEVKTSKTMGWYRRARRASIWHVAGFRFALFKPVFPLGFP